MYEIYNNLLGDGVIHINDSFTFVINYKAHIYIKRSFETSFNMAVKSKHTTENKVTIMIKNAYFITCGIMNE